MSEPTHPTLAKHEVHAEGACFLQHCSVGDLILPCNAQDTSEAAEVEAFQAILLSGVCGPGFTAV